MFPNAGICAINTSLSKAIDLIGQCGTYCIAWGNNYHTVLVILKYPYGILNECSCIILCTFANCDI